jgi:hypothetical protein
MVKKIILMTNIASIANYNIWHFILTNVDNYTFRAALQTCKHIRNGAQQYLELDPQRMTALIRLFKGICQAPAMYQVLFRLSGKNITNIDLSGCTVSNDDLKVIAKNSPALTQLSIPIGRVYDFTPFSTMTALCKLYISERMGPKKTLMEQLALLTNLTYLQVYAPKIRLHEAEKSQLHP